MNWVLFTAIAMICGIDKALGVLVFMTAFNWAAS
jgi:hypothetical protein